MGLDEQGRFLLEATRSNDNFKIVAIADSDPNLAQQFGKLWNCACYDDYRQLIIQNQLDCLFAAAPLHACVEHLKMALKKKFNIFRMPPFTRNYGEAAELAKLAQAEDVTLAIANLNRFAKPALAMRNFILQNPAKQFFFHSCRRLRKIFYRGARPSSLRYEGQAKKQCKSFGKLRAGRAGNDKQRTEICGNLHNPRLK